MSRRTVTVAVVLVLVALGGVQSGIAARTSTQTLRVDITEWAVVPSTGLVSAGPLRLKVENYGRVRHQLDIIRTHRWGQGLEVRDGRAVGRDAARTVVVAPGQTRSARISLAPGSYVLLDNIRDHYATGAAVSIIVAPPTGG